MSLNLLVVDSAECFKLVANQLLPFSSPIQHFESMDQVPYLGLNWVVYIDWLLTHLESCISAAYIHDRTRVMHLCARPVCSGIFRFHFGICLVTNNWKKFLHVDDNKTELAALFHLKRFHLPSYSTMTRKMYLMLYFPV